MKTPTIDDGRALEHLMDLLAVEGLSGEERAVAEMVREKLIAAGCRARWIGHDRAHRKIAPGWQVGNLIVKIPGTTRVPRRLFSGHLDTVPLCRGAVPVLSGDRIESKGATALGGDNRTAVAAIVTMVESLMESEAPRPPMTLLFTVGEEVGLRGSREVEAKRLGDPAIGFNVDGGDPAKVIIGAIGAERWEAHIHGRSSHAGVHPEDGVSSILIASRAIADVADRGFFGRVVQGKRVGASNAGIVRGGETTNQVSDYVYMKGECRSHSVPFLKAITATYAKAFERAAKSVRSASNVTGRVDFEVRRDYDAFRMSTKAEPVVRTMRAARALGLEPYTAIANGGVDANYLHAKGIPTVTLGAGQHNAHTVEEYVDVAEYLGGCRLLLGLASTV